MLANHLFWRLMSMLFYTHLLPLLQPSIQCYCFLLLALIMMQSHRQSEFCANLMYHESSPGQAGYPTLKRLQGKLAPS